MRTILNELADATRARVALSKKRYSQSDFQGMEHYLPDRYDVFSRLSEPRISFIAEFKRQSPSDSFLAGSYEIGNVAKGYEGAGAAAMSVLTEPTRFGGSLEDLAEARKACSLPLLRKDFVVDEYQIHEARAFGADMVLLIAAILDANELQDLMQACEENLLVPLVELYNLSELDRVPINKLQLLGANNRDLKTFSIDVSRAPNILKHAPDNVFTVAESGYESPDAIKGAELAGMDAILIGSHLMRHAEPWSMLKSLIDNVRTVPDESQD